MFRRLFQVALMLLWVTPAFGSVKEDFMREVIDQCGVEKEEAKKQVTPGRTGTVVQFKICANAEVELPNGCILECSKGGSTIGR